MEIPLLEFEPCSSYAEALDRVAALHGVQKSYWDVWGTEHETSDEAKRAILGSLGIPAGSLEELNRAIEEHLSRLWTRLAPPTAVISAADPGIALSVPAEFSAGVVHAEIQPETGARIASEHQVSSLVVTERRRWDGREYLAARLPLPPLPLGYHELKLEIRQGEGAVAAAVCLIACPDRAWMPEALAGGRRLAGLAISLYGVRSARNWGCGDFTDLERLIDWARPETGVDVIALNPLNAIANRAPFNTSPYLPASALYRNFLYLDIERIEEFSRSVWARRALASRAVRDEIASLRGAPLVEYERAAALKLRFLKALFREFLKDWRASSGRAREFREYADREGELLDLFATYCALDEAMHRADRGVWIWQQWPEEFHDPGSEATHHFAKGHWRSVLFYKYVQWQVDRQAAAAQDHARRSGMAIGLYHDLALATDRCGFDLWANRRFFASGCRVGAPPDDFSPKGQDWGFPPPLTEQHREHCYRLFRTVIRNTLRHGGALRIDHVMRFFRLFWIPDGMEAREGTYVHEPFNELVRIVALESVRNQVLVVGEDLGTVEPYIRETLEKFGILSYRLLFFEKNSGEFRRPDEYPVQALVSSTTHDLPTLAGFWQGRDIEVRHAAGLLGGEADYRAALAARAAEKQKLLDAFHGAGLLPAGYPARAEQLQELTGELHNAAIGYLAATPSMLLVINQEELTKETEQQNLPATTWQYPNWRRKMKFSVEELFSARPARDFAAMLRHWLARTGRTGL